MIHSDGSDAASALGSQAGLRGKCSQTHQRYAIGYAGASGSKLLVEGSWGEIQLSLDRGCSCQK